VNEAKLKTRKKLEKKRRETTLDRWIEYMDS
jgi:hypothetical protein